jgi:hypothetical protein
MKLDLIYAETQDALNIKVEAELLKGWVKASDVLTVRPPNIDRKVPHFIYFVQILAFSETKKTAS